MPCEELKFHSMNATIKLATEGCIVREVLLIRMRTVADCLPPVIIRTFTWLPFTGMAIIELNDWIHGCAYQAMKYNASVQEDMSIGGIINVHLMSAN